MLPYKLQLYIAQHAAVQIDKRVEVQIKMQNDLLSQHNLQINLQIDLLSQHNLQIDL